MNSGKKRLRVLVSAYSCLPGRGSEPGVGWNSVKSLAAHHDLWVLTRENNRSAIDEELALRPIERLNFLYYDSPKWLCWWKKGSRGVQLYYYLWQLGAIGVARKAHQEIGFDLGHHVTFVKYWVPSFLAFLDIPYLWGPVGGGESTPRGFHKTFNWRGKIYEWQRSTARFLAHLDPLVRLTAKRASLAIATSAETADAVKRLKVKRCKIMTQVGLTEEELSFFDRFEPDNNAGKYFLSIGNLLHWKGFHLGLEAFAQAKTLHQSHEYWFIGDGPQRRSLQKMAGELGVADRVRFLGKIPRQQVLQHLKGCIALLHPSLHESGGFVCAEALAAGTPVICLDHGGPGVLVPPNGGVLVEATNPTDVIKKISEAMANIFNSVDLKKKLGKAAQQHANKNLGWEEKAKMFSKLYYEIVGH